MSDCSFIVPEVLWGMECVHVLLFVVKALCVSIVLRFFSVTVCVCVCSNFLWKHKRVCVCTLIYSESCVLCGCCALTVTHCESCTCVCMCVCVICRKSSVLQCSNSRCLSVVPHGFLWVCSPDVISVKAGDRSHTELSYKSAIGGKKTLKHTEVTSESWPHSLSSL